MYILLILVMGLLQFLSAPIGIITWLLEMLGLWTY